MELAQGINGLKWYGKSRNVKRGKDSAEFIKCNKPWFMNIGVWEKKGRRSKYSLWLGKEDISRKKD